MSTQPPIYYTPSGRLTAYAISLGCVEVRGDLRLGLALGSTRVYWVRGWSRTDQDRHVSKTFRSLTEARRFFDSHRPHPRERFQCLTTK